MKDYLVVLALVSQARADNIEWNVKAYSKLEAYNYAKKRINELLSEDKAKGIYTAIVLVEEI